VHHPVRSDAMHSRRYNKIKRILKAMANPTITIEGVPKSMKKKAEL
jgi:hypothetical protein